MELKDVIHYFLGQNYRMRRKFYPEGKWGGWGALTIRDLSELLGYEDSAIQLALRRLEDMTEEEMIGVLQLHVPDDLDEKPTSEDYDLDMFHKDGGNLVDSDIAVGAEYTCICYQGQIAIRHNGNIYLYDEAGKEESRIDQSKAFHYLLQQGFDLFSLIDSGLAVDAKNLTDK